MRIALLAYGTRGDVQPFIVLAHALKRRGHEVRLAAQGLFADWIRAEGLDYWPAAGNSKTILDDRAGRAMFESRNPWVFYRAFGQVMQPLMTELLEDSLALCQGCDLLLYGMGAFIAPYSAEACGIPAVPVTFLPVSRSRLQPSELLTANRLGRVLNAASHIVVEQAVWQPLRPIINRLRKERLQQPRVGWLGNMAQYYTGRRPILGAFSPAVCPLPADWPSWHPATGYWINKVPQAYAPSAPLLKFLSAGEAPVYIGFGSMQDQDSAGLTRDIRALAMRSSRRFVLHRGWANLGGLPLPPNMCEVEDVPHQWLFPHMAAVVHHGGAGTTAAALHAGVPSVVVPFGLDQPFWARRVIRLGVGTMLARPQLSPERLQEAIERVCASGDMREAAERLAKALGSEDGVSRAVEFVEDFVASQRRSNRPATT